MRTFSGSNPPSFLANHAPFLVRLRATPEPVIEDPFTPARAPRGRRAFVRATMNMLRQETMRTSLGALARVACWRSHTS